MSIRIKTSNQTCLNLDKIQNKLRLSSKAAILRICLSISLNMKEELEFNKDIKTDAGFDISLDTLFGEYALMFRVLIKNYAKKDLKEKEIAKHALEHIERGMVICYGEFALSDDNDAFISKLLGG